MSLAKEDKQDIKGIIAEAVAPLATKVDIRDAVEELATITAKGFEAVDLRFNAVEKRFEAIDQRFDTIDKRFDKVEGDIGDVRTDLKPIKKLTDHHSAEIMQLKAQAS